MQVDRRARELPGEYRRPLERLDRLHNGAQPEEVGRLVARLQQTSYICHRYHRLYPWRKICHVEKFQISVKNLNNLWSFTEIYAVFILN